MTNYTMPVLSEEDRERLIKYCEYRIKELAGYSLQGKCLQIALAALTAKPVENVIYKGHLLHPSELRLSAHSEPELYYSVPPVPVKQEGEQ